MVKLSLKNIKKSFGTVDVIKGVDIDINDGEFVVFVGPSGCGKSTLLRMIAGLESITDGTLTIDNQVVNEMQPKDRGVAMVFQSYAIFPHMTVRENVAFGLTIAGASKQEKQEKVDAAAKILQIEHLLDRRPNQLSGGQRQRVAIGRAIVKNPNVFLFDEPLSNLDASLRMDMRMEIGKLHEKLKATMIYVTHDQVEAMTLADKIVALKDGEVMQVGSPMDLYHNPANLFVAGFLGAPSMNFIEVQVTDIEEKTVTVTNNTLSPISIDCPDKVFTVGQSVILGIRPQYLNIAPEGQGMLSGQVVLNERLGSETVVKLSLTDNSHIIASLGEDCMFKVGETLHVTFCPTKAQLFAKEYT